MKKFSLARLENAQNKIQHGYIERHHLDMEEREYLHMFFSPSRVPCDLTLGEIRICAAIFKQYKRKLGNVTIQPPVYTFPHRMTRSAFLKLLQQALKRLNKP